MIDYTPLWNTMKEKDISQYDLLNHGIDKRTLQRLRTDQNITALTIENSARYFTVHQMILYDLFQKKKNNTAETRKILPVQRYFLYTHLKHFQPVQHHVYIHIKSAF